MEKQKKSLYEGMYILSATLSDDARAKALERITDGITTRGGEMQKVFEQGRKKLAYEIEGRRDGYYYVLYFEAQASAISEMWEEYHLNEDLVRFITLRTETVPEAIEFKQLEQEA